MHVYSKTPPTLLMICIELILFVHEYLDNAAKIQLLEIVAEVAHTQSSLLSGPSECK